MESSSEVASPISQLTPLFTASFSALKVVFGFMERACRPLKHLSPAPLLLYLLAPLFVFLDITATIFLRAPYRTVVYLLEAVFPLYVFIGVACITGGILGMAARALSRIVVVSLQDPDSNVSPDGSVSLKDEPQPQVVNIKERRQRKDKSKLAS